ncbi:MAG: type IX secretion system sortase PorU [Bacteroidia bacterium]|jgi:hypothetical protein|nr:type IX secretion system sortase PorU [Bacteroidia bacterium]
MKKAMNCGVAAAIGLAFLPSLYTAQTINSRQARAAVTELHWGAPVTSEFSETERRTFLWFKEASYSPERNYLPLYEEQRALPAGSRSATVQIVDAVYAPLSFAEAAILGNAAASLGTEAEVDVKVGISRRQPMASITVVPLRRNASSNAADKLISFRLVVQSSSASNMRTVTARTYAANSVLANGDWHRIGIAQTGVHKLSYQFFANMGYDMATLDPRTIRLYGNGRGQLSFSNAAAHYDDLNEYAIQVVGETDGTFDTDDYVLFYGTSPHRWKFDPVSSRFRHNLHNYSDSTFYFITTAPGTAKRVTVQSSSSLTPTHNVTSFTDYAYHEQDLENLIKSGREWYGEKFDLQGQYSFSFAFPNIDNTTQAWVYCDLVSRLATPHTYNVSAQSGAGLINVPAANVSSYYDTYALFGTTQFMFTPTSSSINVSVARGSNASGALGWLNQIELNVRRQLLMTSGQMQFRDHLSAGAGNVARYTLGNAIPQVSIWDVTAFGDARLQQVTVNGNIHEFVLPADSIREFIAFDGTQYLTAAYEGKVANQNLHAQTAVDYVIVAHPMFWAQANELGQMHNAIDGLTYTVVTPQQIYNEFSSGAQDITAIRDFIRMLYDRALTPEEMPKYVLLFGDGSYDNKYKLPQNTNMIPTFQNANSVTPTISYTSDEFYGLLDDSGEWDGSSDVGYVDVGIGRFPVHTLEEAEAVMNKIRRYMANDPISTVTACGNGQDCSSTGEWRNWIAFIGDDEDSGIHMSQSDQLATMVDTAYDNYNIDKIYFDAFQQEQTPGGERYPGVVEAINRRMDRGALIVNYTGHGGEVGLAHEQAVNVPQINNWKNLCNMPLFVTATCEFSRFDDPSRTSAGEYVLLNPNGGGIGLLTTVRLVYSSPNFILNRNFYEAVFDTLNGELPRIGDVYRITKVTSGNNTNNRNFTLLGDPALRLRYPKNKVVTTEVNNQPLNPAQPDTLRALSRVTITGFVADQAGNKLNGFNGVLYPTVFDKTSTITTLGNDPPNSPITFKFQKNIIYRGKVSVVNGDYTFSFVVPRDISYQFDNGRISYYAYNGQTDASGFCEDIIIGGTNPNAPADNNGPQVRLFMNDTNFAFGGITNASPTLLAIVSDSNGINTVGNGIGHDIVAVIDEQTSNAIVLNDFYQSDLNSFQRGRILYPLSNLSEGRHTLSLKVWDVYNNSTTVTTEFTVVKNNGLQLEHVLNYPNPFTTRTEFYFESNQCCTQFDVMVQVFTVSGKLVKTINETVQNEGFRSAPIIWDGKDDFGDNIGRGVYVYRMVVRGVDGQSAEQYEKLVIL